MCGIGTLTLDKTAPANLALDKAATALLEALDHRGGDACGYLAISAGGRVDCEKAPCEADDFNRYRRAIPEGTRALAVHTRMATQGLAAFNRNNHPVMHGNAFVVHNGVIWETASERRRTLGQPEVDTWQLARTAAEVARRKKGEHPQAHAERIARALLALDGSAAVGVAFKSQAFLVTARLVGSPLYAAEAHGVRIAASTRDAVAEAFEALDMEVPTRQVNKRETVGKGKRKRERVYTVSEPAIEYVPEGGVLSWDAGMHAHGKVAVPAWQAAHSYSYGWEDAAEYVGGKYIAPAPGREAERTYASIAERLLEQQGRCEICQEPGPISRAWGMDCCEACTAAFRASGAESEVEA